MGNAVRVLALGGIAALLSGPATAADTGTEWKARSELSFVRTSGNTDTETFAGKFEASADATPNRYFATVKGLYGKTSQEVTTSRWTIGGRYERALTERLFAFAAADYLKDTYAGYDMRIAVGPGVGYDFLKGGAHTLKGLLSVLYVQEDIHSVPEPDDDTEAYTSGKAEGNYAWQITETLRFKQNADFSISFEDSDVYFANSETGLEAKLSDKLALGLSYLVNYQNAPAAGAESTDTTFLTSLVVDF
jgi:putative salt-induced outer membrane protein